MPLLSARCSPVLFPLIVFLLLFEILLAHVPTLPFVLLSAQAGTGPIGEFLKDATGTTGEDFEVGYGQARFSPVKTSYLDEKYEAADEKFRAAIPASEKLTASPDIAVRNIKSRAKLPNTNQKLPTALWNARVKLHHKTFNLGNAAAFGFHIKTGQATDQLFESFSNNLYDLTAYLGGGPNQKSYFYFFVNFANNRPVLNEVPLPGFSYGMQLSPYWGISLGFPHFGLWIIPFDWLKFTFTAEPIAHLETRLLVKFSEAFQVYWSGESIQESYKLHNRADSAEQLFYNSLLYRLGIINDFGFFNGDFSAGLAANRSYLHTDDYLRDRQSQLLRIANGFVVKFDLGIKI